MRAAVGTLVLLLAANLAVAGQAAGPESTGAEQPDPLSISYDAEHAHTVTVSTPSGPAVVMEFPAGVLVALEVPVEGNPAMPEALKLPSTFRGDIKIKARRTAEVASDEEGRAATVTAGAPIRLELENVVVTVERESAAAPASYPSAGQLELRQVPVDETKSDG